MECITSIRFHGCVELCSFPKIKKLEKQMERGGGSNSVVSVTPTEWADDKCKFACFTQY